AAIAVAAVGAPALASQPSRVLLSFGAASTGALGRTAYEDGDAGSTPTRIVLPAATGEATQVAVGADHSVPITATGQVFTFGSNEWGQLGSARRHGTSHLNVRPEPILLPGDTSGARAAAAGPSFSLVLANDGRVFAFGEDFFGQLGAPLPRG